MTNPFGNTSSFGAATSLPMAEGGYVNRPTNALIGEGGEPEYVIPESKMRESMARYSRGSRGGGVIPSDGGSSASGDGGVAVAAPIDVRYTVERINNVEYVTADQFQSGMQRAAQQGAQRGEQNTLKRLQLSSGTRRRLGI
jgi:SLT domain-containing protein